MDMAWIKKRIGADAEASRKACKAMELVDHSIRSVQRISSELRPPMLEDPGLGSAIDWQVKNFSKRTGILGYFTDHSEGFGFDEKKALALYRICQESLTNIVAMQRQPRHGSNSREIKTRSSWKSGITASACQRIPFTGTMPSA